MECPVLGDCVEMLHGRMAVMYCKYSSSGSGLVATPKRRRLCKMANGSRYKAHPEVVRLESVERSARDHGAMSKQCR